jgi:hypothetical protein
MKIKFPGQLVIEERILDDIVTALKSESEKLKKIIGQKDPRLPEVYWMSVQKDFELRSAELEALADKLESAEWEEVE